MHRRRMRREGMRHQCLKGASMDKDGIVSLNQSVEEAAGIDRAIEELVEREELEGFCSGNACPVKACGLN